MTQVAAPKRRVLRDIVKYAALAVATLVVALFAWQAFSWFVLGNHA